MNIGKGLAHWICSGKSVHENGEVDRVSFVWSELDVSRSQR